MKSDFVDAVKSACAEALSAYDFRQPRKHQIVLDISEDFLGWVGLNTGNYPAYVRVNPFVGVHCISIMRTVAELESVKYQSGSIATFAIHLGELTPNEPTLDFSDPSEIALTAKRLARVVGSYGAAYMRKISDLEVLLPLLKDRVGQLGGFPERYAVGLLLAGQAANALMFVAQKQAEYADKGGVIRDSFDKFAEAFIKFASSRTGTSH